MKEKNEKKKDFCFSMIIFNCNCYVYVPVKSSLFCWHSIKTFQTQIGFKKKKQPKPATKLSMFNVELWKIFDNYLY